MHGRRIGLRANRILVATPAVEETIDEAIRAYSSQEKIIEDLGGKIWATSKLGIGTIMYFVIRKYQVADIQPDGTTGGTE